MFDYGKVIVCNDKAKNFGAKAQKPKKSKDKHSQLQVVEMMDNVSLHSDIELEHSPHQSHQDLDEDGTLPAANATLDLDSDLQSVKDNFKQHKKVSERPEVKEADQKHESTKVSQHTRTKGTSMFSSVNFNCLLIHNNASMFYKAYVFQTSFYLPVEVMILPPSRGNGIGTVCVCLCSQDRTV